MYVTATATNQLAYENAVHLLMASGLPEFSLKSSPALHNEFEHFAVGVNSLSSIQTQGLAYSRGGLVQSVQRRLFLTPSEQQLAIVRCALIAERIPGLMSSRLSLYQRCMCLYTYLYRNCSYRLESADDHNIMTFLHDGKGCCQAISAFAFLVLNAAGIPCFSVVGNLDRGNTKHGWNIVRDRNGMWYHIDYSACSLVPPVNTFSAIGRSVFDQRYSFDHYSYSAEALNAQHNSNVKRRNMTLHISLQNSQDATIEYRDGTFVKLHLSEPLLCKRQNEWFVALPSILDLFNGGIVRARGNDVLVVNAWNNTTILNNAHAIKEYGNMLSVTVLKKLNLHCSVENNSLILTPYAHTQER